mgnify:CR=1 FL=1
MREKGKEALLQKAQQLLSKPNVVAQRVGLEPDGYQAWLTAEVEKEAAKKAAKGGGATLLLEMAPQAVTQLPPEAVEDVGGGVAESPGAKLAKLAASASPGTRRALEAARAALENGQ